MTASEVIARIEQSIEALWGEVPALECCEPDFCSEHQLEAERLLDEINELEDLLELPTEDIVALAPHYIYIPPDERQLSL